VSDLGKHGQSVGRRHLHAAAVLVVDQGLLDRAQFVGLLRVVVEVAVELSDRDERGLPGMSRIAPVVGER
jgi:hypothetical protein